MKKFSHAVLILILTLVPALTGCGGGGGTPTPIGYTPGQSSVCTVGGVSFTMRYAPTGSFTSDDNTISGDPNLPGPINVANAYWIAETEVTYKLWTAVYTWATDAARGAYQYYFQNAGKMGDDSGTGTDQHPATSVNWRDAMVWCNALTEYYNAQNGTSLACVYVDNTNAIIRDSRDSNAAVCDNATADSTAKGFRLPTSDEWELAARYKDGSTWTAGNYASGAAAAYTDAVATAAVAWYHENSASSTHPVGEKSANALNLRDMSGNVREWCFDRYPVIFGGSCRILRGGDWSVDADYLQVGYVDYGNPGDVNVVIGFRPVRTQ
ncbi:MAG: formylglycine-generating enzyme family protein [Bacteroidota bacterium]